MIPADELLKDLDDIGAVLARAELSDLDARTLEGVEQSLRALWIEVLRTGWLGSVRNEVRRERREDGKPDINLEE